VSTSDVVRPGVVGRLGLEHDDRSGADTLASGCRCEIPYQPVDQAADLAMKPGVVAKEHAEHLGNGEDELAMGQPQQKLLVHVLAKQKGPFLRSRGAEVEDLTTEGAQVLDPTAGIRALDPGDALGVVPAFQEAAHRLGDPLQAELSLTLGEVSPIARTELREVRAEQTLQGADSSLAVIPWGCRIQGQHQLVGHKGINDPEEPDAFPSQKPLSPIGATFTARAAMPRPSGGMSRTRFHRTSSGALSRKPMPWASPSS